MFILNLNYTTLDRLYTWWRVQFCHYIYWSLISNDFEKLEIVSRSKWKPYLDTNFNLSIINLIVDSNFGINLLIFYGFDLLFGYINCFSLNWPISSLNVWLMFWIKSFWNFIISNNPLKIIKFVQIACIYRQKCEKNEKVLFC